MCLLFLIQLDHELELQDPKFKGHVLLAGKYLFSTNRLENGADWKDHREELLKNRIKTKSLTDSILIHSQVVDWQECEDLDELLLQEVMKRKNTLAVFSGPILGESLFYLFKRGVSLQRLLQRDLGQS